MDIEVLTQVNFADPTQELALAVLEGLSSHPKSLPSRLFYDDRGSQLFQQIMASEDYYPTRCEAEILSKDSGQIASKFGGKKFNLIELGSGDGAKTKILLRHLLDEQAQFLYAPLDISKGAIESLNKTLKTEFGESLPFDVKGLVAEYFNGLAWMTQNTSEQNLVLFLGSNIGNFTKSTALRFLRHLWQVLNHGDRVLIGFDLNKDLDVLYYAYNDREGITREFNFNVLDRINRELGANFDRARFQHHGLYNTQTGAMESYLLSQSHQQVQVDELGKSFELRPWEPIHMEYSYKYLIDDIEFLAANTGFRIEEHFSDSKGYFVDSLWQVNKS